ncbi:hypothetical protein [Mucilaginibacter terrae]|uniref:Cthe-2314-like HEPN domain-containing protein n=1 Tax=Mucilaginibacter terrae TaxID=1955052 RepID=A0ABU3GNM7_9SPHI|nr:hypothetical protein [Mucilaginibacter terrae]MDT3401389.1 hypothetical protein [Mucilaginibacter terrae]
MKSLESWHSEIMAHMKGSGLINLSEYKNNGTSIFITFTDITRSKRSLKEFDCSDFKHADDFNFISQDLIYSISILELLHPKINNALKENGTYHQNLEDHMYLRYASYSLQTIYSFWDRIGDFLDFFFDTKQKGDVYLSRVLDRFPQNFRSTTYDELLDLYKVKVLPVVTERHLTVHTFTLKAKFYWGVIEHGGRNYEKLEALQKEKDSYPSLFREQLNYMFNGFTLALKLVSELPDNLPNSKDAVPIITE